MHVGLHRVADDSTGMQIQSHGEVQPALSGGQRGDVRRPYLIRVVDVELTREKVWRHRQSVFTVSRPYPAGFSLPSQSRSAHQSGHPLAGDPDAFSTSLRVNAGRSVSSLGADVDALDALLQQHILLRTG